MATKKKYIIALVVIAMIVLSSFLSGKPDGAVAWAVIFGIVAWRYGKHLKVLSDPAASEKYHANKAAAKQVHSYAYDPRWEAIKAALASDDKDALPDGTTRVFRGLWTMGFVYYDKPLMYPGDELFLRHEPGNEYDENAIEVLAQDGKKLGYIAAGMAPTVLPHLKSKDDIRAAVREYDDLGAPTIDIVRLHDIKGVVEES